MENTSIAVARAYVRDKDYRRAIFELTDNLKKEPNHIETRLLRAESYLNIGLYADAVIDYEKAFSNPDTIATLGMLYYYCKALYKSEQYEKAKLQLKGVLNCDQNFTAANKMMAEVLLQTSDFEQAVYYLSKVISATPEDVDAIFMRAQGFYKLKKFTEAIIDFRLAISMYDHSDFHLHLGICLFNGGRQAEGVEELKIAQRLGNPEAEQYLEFANSI